MNKQRIFEIAKQAGFELLDTGRGDFIVEDGSNGSAIELFVSLIELEVRGTNVLVERAELEWLAECSDSEMGDGDTARELAEMWLGGVSGTDVIGKWSL